jgi:uncharacterized phosphosugar-binding protein
VTKPMAEYLAQAAERIASVLNGQDQAFEAAVSAITRSIETDGLIYLFGTGHSHMMAEEGHYRAGGLACVVPILSAMTMLHEGAIAGSALERTSGLARIVLSRYQIAPGDVLIVFSNSGVNAVPVEAAQEGRALGATVIAVTSDAYSRQAAHGRLRLADVADIGIDNRSPPGDALVEIEPDGLRVGPVSTVVGAAILNALLVETASRLMRSSRDAPVYVSANMPEAAERNKTLSERYRDRNPHL